MRPPKPVYGMMITGRTDERIQWAKACIERFVTLQTYRSQAPVYVYVFNEHPNQSIHSSNDLSAAAQKMVKEWKISDRKAVTLGTLRNQLLSLIPSNSYVYVLDDDDYVPSNLIEKLIENWPDDNTALIQLCNRLNHNLLTHKSWQSHFNSGFVHYLADIDLLRKTAFRYTNVNTLEDLPLHHLTAKERYLWKENPVSLYIRYTHQHNTSPYVRKEQKDADTTLQEGRVTGELDAYCVRHAPRSYNQTKQTLSLFSSQPPLDGSGGLLLFSSSSSSKTPWLVLLSVLLLSWWIHNRRRKT